MTREVSNDRKKRLKWPEKQGPEHKALNNTFLVPEIILISPPFVFTAFSFTLPAPLYHPSPHLLCHPSGSWGPRSSFAANKFVRIEWIPAFAGMTKKGLE